MQDALDALGFNTKGLGQENRAETKKEKNAKQLGRETKGDRSPYANYTTGQLPLRSTGSSAERTGDAGRLRDVVRSTSASASSFMRRIIFIMLCVVVVPSSTSSPIALRTLAHPSASSLAFSNRGCHDASLLLSCRRLTPRYRRTHGTFRRMHAGGI